MNNGEDMRVRVNYKNKTYKAHRLAWFLYYGEFPKYVIDHINHDVTDNRLSNLRDVSVKTNCRNQLVNKDNKIGILGVSLLKNGRYRVGISVNSKKVYVGEFNSFEKAVKSRRNAEITYGYKEVV